MKMVIQFHQIIMCLLLLLTLHLSFCLANSIPHLACSCVCHEFISSGNFCVELASNRISSPLTFSFQESDSDFAVDSFKHTISSLPCFERYAMKPFFGQHDNIIDLNLEDYIKHKIPFGSHTPVLRILVLERHLIGEGSHRRLSSSIKFSVPQDLSAEFSSQICEVIIIERLPSGVFADPFELDHILHRGVFKDAYVFGDTNLELPSFLSNQSVVEIHLDAALSTSSAQEIVKEFKIEIPLHARYPPLEEIGYSTVRFDIPDLFLHCKSKNNEEEPAQTCLLKPIAGNDGLQAHDITWSIPAGMEAHAPTVSVVTFITALFSVILIVIASLKHTRMDSDARFRQS